MKGLPGFELTEEKVKELKPLIERILSKKYGREIKFIDLTIGEISINCEEETQ